MASAHLHPITTRPSSESPSDCRALINCQHQHLLLGHAHLYPCWHQLLFNNLKFRTYMTWIRVCRPSLPAEVLRIVAAKVGNEWLGILRLVSSDLASFVREQEAADGCRYRISVPALCNIGVGNSPAPSSPCNQKLLPIPCTAHCVQPMSMSMSLLLCLLASS